MVSFCFAFEVARSAGVSRGKPGGDLVLMLLVFAAGTMLTRSSETTRHSLPTVSAFWSVRMVLPPGSVLTCAQTGPAAAMPSTRTSDAPIRTMDRRDLKWTR